MLDFLYIPFPDWLVRADQKVFEWVNVYFTNPFLDWCMPLMRNAFLWAPLYIFIVAFMLFNYKKNGLIWVIFLLCTVATTDLTGARIFKELFERLRPCNDPEMLGHIRMLLGRCSGGFSFVSNHAINHFGVSMFIFYTLHRQLKYTWILFIWAGIIGYAQIYVGVHYPFDVLCGTLLGLCIGIITGKIFKKRYGFHIFGKQSIVI